jgi:phage-related protein
MANEVEIKVTSRDDTRGALDKSGKGLTSLKSRLNEVLKPLAMFTLQAANMAGTAISAGQALAPAVHAVLGFGKAMIQASPALLAFAVAGGFVALTLRKIFGQGSAARAALSPLKKGFDDAGVAASKAAASGVKPLAEQLNKVASPIVRDSMVKIGQATNVVTKGFLGWAKSTAGLKSLHGILDPIGKSVTTLAPHVTQLAISFASMIGRIMGVSLAAGTGGLAGILDKLSGLLDRINAKTVGGGIAKMKEDFVSVIHAASTFIDWVKKAIDFYRRFQKEFSLLSDAIAVVAIAFGGPVAAIIAAIGIIIRHFDQLKKAGQAVKDFFTKTPQGAGFIDNVKKAAEEVWPHVKSAFEKIKSAVLPVLSEIGHKITNDFIPAFGQFIKAAAPVVGFLVDVFGPMVASTFKNVLKDISGVITMITGILQVFTGILTGNFGKIGQGLKNIFKGFGESAWATLKSIFPPLNEIGTTFKSIGKLVREIFGKPYRLALSVNDKVSGVVRSVASTVSRFAKGVYRVNLSALNKVAGPVRSAISACTGFVRRAYRANLNALNRTAGPVRSAISACTGFARRVYRASLTAVSRVGAALASALRDGYNWARRVFTATFNVRKVLDFVNPFKAAGGIVGGLATGGVARGMAGGGPGGSLTWVGEQGAELVRLPTGSQVYPHGQSRGMAARAGGGGEAHVVLEWAGGNAGDSFMRWLKENIRARAGSGPGSVQRALG